MNTPSIRGAFAATSVLALAALSLAQGTPSQQPKQQPQEQGRTQDPQGQNPQRGAPGQSSSQGFDTIADAYRNLHQVTLTTLQSKARDWKEKDSAKPGDSERAAGEANRSGSALAADSISLRAEELLIAACPDGLLAGAPATTPMGSTGMGTNRPAGGTGSPADDRNDPAQGLGQGQPTGSVERPGQSGTRPEIGQSIGMILVCEHSSAGMAGAVRKPAGEPRDAGAERSGATREASSMSTSGTLEEGVYCVKQSGNSIWLTDAQGQTVLRTTLDRTALGAGSRPGEPRAGDAKSGDVGQDPRDTTGTTERTHQRSADAGLAQSGSASAEWERVFGAIAEEAMRSMGWTKRHGMPATTR